MAPVEEGEGPKVVGYFLLLEFPVELCRWYTEEMEAQLVLMKVNLLCFSVAPDDYQRWQHHSQQYKSLHVPRRLHLLTH